jgi:hypothetical protein
MSILNSKFDILRGYPNGSALVWPFAIKKVAGTPVALPAGTLVTQELSGAETVVDLATTPDVSSADPIEVWLVVEGNDDFSGEFVKKCATAKPGSGLIWETDAFAAGSYTPGTPVSFNAGQIKVKAANEQIVGYVLEDRTATKGTVVVSA